MYMKKYPIVSSVTWNLSLRKSGRIGNVPWKAPMAIA